MCLEPHSKQIPIRPGKTATAVLVLASGRAFGRRKANGARLLQHQENGAPGVCPGSGFWGMGPLGPFGHAHCVPGTRQRVAPEPSLSELESVQKPRSSPSSYSWDTAACSREFFVIGLRGLIEAGVQPQIKIRFSPWLAWGACVAGAISRVG